jgi:hypothetical protein
MVYDTVYAHQVVPLVTAQLRANPSSSSRASGCGGRRQAVAQQYSGGVGQQQQDVRAIFQTVFAYSSKPVLHAALIDCAATWLHSVSLPPAVL